jgi:endonuclease III
LKDYWQLKSETISKLVKTGSLHMAQAEEILEALKSLSDRARSPRERTALNIIIDDQRKVIRALQRMINDASDMTVDLDF